MVNRLLALLAAASVAMVLSDCGGAEAKTDDISPIFPLTAGKCAKYGGDEQGSGPTATCMVTRSDCEKAAADWRKAMREGGVNDAIEFRC